jgi:hypothetical protein
MTIFITGDTSSSDELKLEVEVCYVISIHVYNHMCYFINKYIIYIRICIIILLFIYIQVALFDMVGANESMYIHICTYIYIYIHIQVALFNMVDADGWAAEDYVTIR